MRNPAWRPARLHAERLAGIQHHFIDGRAAGSDTGQQVVVRNLPVCMAQVPDHPADALQPHTLVDALTRELNRQSSTVAGPADWQLESVAPEAAAMLPPRGFLLVFATANLEGVRLAYTVIRGLAASPARQFGVLFGGAPDEEQAYRCQQRLAAGARRFLDIHLHGLGHLPASGPDFSVNLACLAERVRLLWDIPSTHHPQEIAHP